ncbi:MAG: phosphate acyltransferase PlsX [Patescibacteria group bacterium]|nr:phosphate acyltransferase PlsX [Patescibacteria group bacterium]
MKKTARNLIIAIDAMGGDHGPNVVVKGAMEAAREFGIIPILIGRFLDISPEVRKFGLKPEFYQALPDDPWEKYDGSWIPVLQTDQMVEMKEHPRDTIRKKPASTIALGLKMVKKGEAAAFVSAGNTGAIMVNASYYLRRIEGIERPALGIVLPTKTGRVVVLDIGANSDCKPEYLVQFGFMGSCYAKLLGSANPRVGLLNIGEEETKGNQLTLSAYPLFGEQRSLGKINFVGNVEGKDITAGLADVVVCDGFVGNVLIKSAEGTAKYLQEIIKEELTANWLRMIVNLPALLQLRRVKKRLDYAEWGGSPLLGIDGVCIVAHGRSSPKAIRNAIRVAKEVVEQDLVQMIQREVEKDFSACR